MTVITQELLANYNPYYYTDYKTVLKGQQLFRDHRVKVTELTGDRAVCEVDDEGDIYAVDIQAYNKKQLIFLCECPEFEQKRCCKHVVASIQGLSNYLLTEAEDNWKYRLSLVLDNSPKRAAAASQRQHYAILFGLQKTDFYSTTRFSLQTLILKASDWVELKKLEGLDPETFNQRLDADPTWRRYVRTPFQALHPTGCINLPWEGVSLANLMMQSGRFYYDSSCMNYLSLMARLNVPLFRFDGTKLGDRLQILSEPMEVEVAIGRQSPGPGKGTTNFVLEAGLEVNGQMFTSVKESLDVISTDPAWVIAGRFLLPIKNTQSLPLLAALPLTIPAGEEEAFREGYLREIAERVPVKGDVVAWEDVAGDAVPRLYLQDSDGTLRANLLFAYGDYEVPAQNMPEELSVVDVPGSWGMVRVHRQPERETEYLQMLSDAQYRLKRATRDFPPGTYELRARVHPFDFLMYSIPRLTEAGFEIFGEEKLKSGKINRNKPTIMLSISSGVDWFDLEAVVKYGDQSVALRDIHRAMRRKERFVKLADGSIGQIPEAWLERYKHLFDMAEETPDGELRVTDYHLPLVDSLLEEAELAQVAPEFEQRRSRLRSFEHIESCPVAAGFDGELRPYQKVGVDWLHFLHDYGFGGCLADDMGLGKTIEVLAFLQSLREQNQLGAACLLVVPKSLITNWQREIIRFTPDLRVLIYMGNTRIKDTGAFKDYDIVITTYGTMLRDIETLRTYRFCYAILDESQAIKNPVALSSKAARLLSAEHKLALTGTPVENNTFELWSQFAFLNPGLLGNMDYFKREFATPIESDHDVESTQLLRKLVYPFILRRTKEQVAPELPPLTERTLYTDMEPAQKKLYNQTRDHYRGVLMGLIDSEGIGNDIRMKILEGLLRLRQICIHPALVEPAYRGDAPKFELLFDTLQSLRDEGHKALVFSQFVETLKIARKELDARHIPYAYLDGQTRDRQAQVDLFQNDAKVPFFLISLKAGGVGLNLTAADYVIHLDPWWNPAVEMQASDRAHRIGQDKPVFVYKIITRDTVEEKILQLQDRKRELVSQLISTEESFFKSLSADDVKVLFS